MPWFNLHKKTTKYSLDFIGIDMHSHLLPSIDDGAKTIEDSLRYIKALQQLGLSTFYTTPHIFMEVYPNNPQIIQQALSNVVEYCKIHDVQVTIHAAAEYMMDEQFAKVLAEQTMQTINKKYVLVELPHLYDNPMAPEYIFKLKIDGYTPILAHPERYRYYHQSFDNYYRFKELGCLLQINLLSIAGYYGKDVQKIAIKLLDKGCIDIVGTDLHHDRHVEALSNFTASGELHAILSQYPIQNKKIF